jgi:hypothetical protein
LIDHSRSLRADAHACAVITPARAQAADLVRVISPPHDRPDLLRMSPQARLGELGVHATGVGS